MWSRFYVTRVYTVYELNYRALPLSGVARYMLRALWEKKKLKYYNNTHICSCNYISFSLYVLYVFIRMVGRGGAP